ncbi:hypothetical protein KFU94_31480 [Chloroflexi bacterium TSY]|nr:hypothetical protein [Chloroflexi bacterium TSY]
MPRPLFDSEYIFGIHEPGGERHMLDAGKPGWIVFTEEIGHDPQNRSGKNFFPWSNQNLGIICRLNNGYEPNGTIPNSREYENFAQRCANYVEASPGCKIWIVGNEMNFHVERPPLNFAQSASPISAAAPMTTSSERRPSGHSRTKSIVGQVLRFVSGGMGDSQLFAESWLSDRELLQRDQFGRGVPERFNAIHSPQGDESESGELSSLEPAATPQPMQASAAREVITPELYARYYRLCRDAIHQVPGHEDDQVLIGAVAPWNNQTTYAGNPAGDWIQYFHDILDLLGPDGVDGITLHTYTHGADPNLIRSEQRMNPPFQNRRFHFRTYQDFMDVVPQTMRHLPLYITETDEDDPWQNSNSGWVQQAYGEIDAWNRRQGNQQIRALILYRWPRIDRWFIDGKQGVINDFRAALNNNYRWRATLPQAAQWRQGARVRTLNVINIRRSPGYVGKPDNDVLGRVTSGAILEVTNSQSSRVDQLVWWQVRGELTSGQTVTGWLAQFTPAGQPLLQEVVDPVPPPGGKFELGDLIRTLTVVRLRRSPGFRNKPANDTLAGIATGTDATILGGPRTA